MLQSLAYFVSVLIVIYLFFRWFERANVWQPTRSLEAHPDEVGLPYEEVFFTAADGVKLHGWYIPSASPAASLLFCHGNAGNISHRLESLRLFHLLALNVFIFDYRGYGKSQGRPSEAGTYRDARAAFDWLHSRDAGLPMVLFGRSLGAAVAVDLAMRVPAAGLIFESGFTSIADLGRELFPWLPVRYLQTIYYDSLNKMAGVKMPVLVVHSPDDEIISFHHGKAIYEAASEPKVFLKIHGDHNEGFLLSERDYLQGIALFLQKYIVNETNRS